MLWMLSGSDAKAAQVVTLALGTTERDARDVALALAADDVGSS